MQLMLSEERSVTERLSRDLELEKRRAESIEHRAAQAASAASAASAGGHGSCGGENQMLLGSLHAFRVRCDGLSESLLGCEHRLRQMEVDVSRL
jgi:hypothetical protein